MNDSGTGSSPDPGASAPDTTPSSSSASSARAEGAAGSRAGGGGGGASGHCVVCGYSLSGLAETGVCPECGTAVALSFSDAQLVHSSPTYLRSLTDGLRFVLVGILVIVALTVAMMIAVFSGIAWAASLVSLGITAVWFGVLYGWWKASEPDPGYTGVASGDKARGWLRNLLIAKVATAGLSFVLSLIPGAELLLFLIGFVDLAVMIAFYVVAMMYVMWLAPRIPDQKIYRRAKMYRWLLVVLVFPGVFLLVGPLVSLVLYWNLLDRLRKAILPIQKIAEERFGVATSSSGAMRA